MSAEPTVAERVRTACEPVHPTAALRDAVLRDLGPHSTVRVSRWRHPASRAALAASVLAAAGGTWFGGWFERGVAPPPVPVVPVEAKRDLEAIAKERAANVAFYEKLGENFRLENTGKWAVISYGSRIITGTALDTVAGSDDPTKPPKHRFVFRVGEEGDKDEFVSTWYAPRFAGMGLVTALDLDFQLGNGVTLKKGSMSVEFHQPTPFPRIRLEIGTPDGKAPLGQGPTTPEVFLGTVGPTLMLTPQDDERLSLERWEVPGRHVVGGGPCRRVLVKVAVPGLGGDAVIVAAVPDIPYERLVAMARSRHRFWDWADVLRASLKLPTPGDERGNWIVFGNDRVLGRGKSADEAIVDADRRRNDVVYHRFVTQWPVPGPLEVDVKSFTKDGVAVPGEEPPPPDDHGDPAVLAVLDGKRIQNVELVDQDLEQVVTYLRTVTGLRIEISPAARAIAVGPTKITMKSTDAPARVVLDGITRSHGLGWAARAGGVAIVTLEEIAKNLGRSDAGGDTFLWKGSDADWARAYALIELAREVVLVDGDRRLPTSAAQFFGVPYTVTVTSPKHPSENLTETVRASSLIVRDPR